jgi:hypothetical protein
MYDCVSKNFRTGRLERELHIVQLSATRCSCIATMWVSLASFAAITLCIASQRVFVVVSVYFVIDSVRKLLDTPSYTVSSIHTAASTYMPSLNIPEMSGPELQKDATQTYWTLNKRHSLQSHSNLHTNILSSPLVSINPPEARGRTNPFGLLYSAVCENRRIL